MAKNKIKIDVIIDGKMQKVSVDAEKLGRKLDKVSEASVKADRNIKGVAGASSNASKNFSKMSQGMGGLVGAYAALAAQIFAISAAFNFLKSAGDLKVLEASQAAYAANTGLAMKVLANDIVSATNAQIAFQDASQAAAIGTAAGLSPDQLKQLGKAANDLSVTLGRDVTDSFNRLVRGVTKAEPELLDELGIILRLKDAQEEYGRMIGKSANELTQFEKSQAVANKVLQEASRVAAVTPEGAVNQYNQLAKAFDDVLIKVKLVADQVAGPLAKVLTETPSLAIASFLLLLKGPLAAMGVNFADIAINARESAAAQKIAASEAQAAYQKTQVTIKSTTAAIREQAAAAVQAGSQSKILQQFGSGGTMTPQARATLKRSLTAAEAQYKTHSRIVSGIFKGMDIKIVQDFQIAMKQLELAEKGKVSSTKVNVAAMVAIYTSGMAKIKAVTAAVITFGTRLLSLFGWVGLAVTAFQVLSNYMGWFKKDTSETEKEVSRLSERMKQLNEEYKDFNEIQNKLAKAGRGAEVFANIATKSSMLDTDQFLEAVKATEEYNKLLEKQRKLAALAPEIKSGEGKKALTESLRITRLELSLRKESKEFISTEIQAINDVIRITKMKPKFAMDYLNILNGTVKATEQETLAARNNFQAYGSAIRESTRLLVDAEAAANDWVQSMAPLSTGDIAVQNIQLLIDNLNSQANANVRLTKEQLDSLRQLSATKKLILRFEEQQNKAKLRGLNLDISQELATRNLSKSYKEVVATGFKVLRTQEAINNKEIELNALIELQKKQPSPSNARRIAELRSEIDLQEAQLETLVEQKTVQESLVPITQKLTQIRLDTEVMSQAKEYLGVLNQQVNTQKELINVQQTVSKLRMQRAERDIQRSNPFAFLREEERVAEATYQLELSMVGTKITQINNEFDIKRQMIGMEHVLLDAKLRVSELELKNRAAATDLEQGEREALQALATATASQRALISQNLGGQFQLLDAQQQAAIEGIIDELDKLDFARENLSDMAVITNNIVRDLHSGLSNVFSDLITNKVSSFKDAMLKAIQGIAESFAKTLSDMFARDLIEGIQGFFSTKQSNPILSAAQQGSIKVASTLKDGATTVANAIRAAFTEGAAKISAAKEEGGVLEKISEFVGPPEKKESKGDFFENVFGSLLNKEQRAAPTGIPSVRAQQPTAAQKLGSMLGVESATFKSSKPEGAQATSGPITGMFSGLMTFMKSLFSTQNPVFKGILGVFNSIIPLLGKILPFLGKMVGSILGIFGFANGGMVKGGFRAYANGGIVSSPTLGLVGEGRYNEAIVPMPNGKAIPVDMKGSQGQNNNITINIESTGATTTSGMSDQDNKQLGKAIAQAVQRELQNQKRSGGILSPYGVS